MKHIIITFLFSFCIGLPLLKADEYVVLSPDKKIKVTVSDSKQLEWSIKYGDEVILNPSRISMTIAESDVVFGVNTKLIK